MGWGGGGGEVRGGVGRSGRSDGVWVCLQGVEGEAFAQA